MDDGTQPGPLVSYRGLGMSWLDRSHALIWGIFALSLLFSSAFPPSTRTMDQTFASSLQAIPLTVCTARAEHFTTLVSVCQLVHATRPIWPIMLAHMFPCSHVPMDASMLASRCDDCALLVLLKYPALSSNSTF